MTLSMTTSSSVDVSTTLATTTDSDTTTLNSYATEQTLLNSSVSDPTSDSSGLALVLGGEATAIGEDTLAVGSMSADLDATGSLATVEGNASFIAVAETTGDETAFVTADSFGGLSGADLLFVLTSNTQIVDQGPDGSLAIATSDITLYGLDFDSTAGGGGSTESDPMLDPLAESELPATMDSTTDDEDLYDLALDIEGNVAVLEVTAEVSGQDTLLEVGASVLTVEDTLSTVTGEIIAAVD
jgi:hypothetical protein